MVILSYLSALFALLAAVFWLVSAKVNTPTAFPIDVSIVKRPNGRHMIQGHSEDLPELGRQLRRQSKWSGWAAACAGMSALLQAVTIVASFKA